MSKFRVHVKTAAVLVCMLIIAASAGCMPAITPEDSYTLEDMIYANSFDSVFSQYNSFRAEYTDFGLPMPDGSREDHSYRAIHVNRDSGMSYYSFWDSSGDIMVIEYRSVTLYDAGDDVIVIYGFFDDGAYEYYYHPYIAEYAALASFEDEEFIRTDISGGVRTVTTHTTLEVFGNAWGLPDGIVEHVYFLDAETGLAQSAAVNLLTDGEPVPLMYFEYFYGQDDDFPEPEFMAAARDMSDVRTLHVVREPNTPEERTFSFTVPTDAIISLFTMDNFSLFFDAELTVPYSLSEHGNEDGTTVYMKLDE